MQGLWGLVEMALNYEVWTKFESSVEPILKTEAEKLNMSVAQFIRSCVFTIIQNLKQENIEVSLIPTREKNFLIKFKKGEDKNK